jgi:Domain of unknown function (DUF4136)
VKIQRIILSLAFVFLIAAVALAQKVSVQVDPGTDFSKYKTYAWGPESHPASNPMTDQSIREGIDAQLSSHGLTKVTENPDLVVMYHTGVDQSLEWDSFGGFGRFGMSQGSVNKVYTGQVMIEIVDPAAKKYVWQGTASDTVSSDANKTQKEITKALTKMFSNFPQPPK